MGWIYNPLYTDEYDNPGNLTYLITLVLWSGKTLIVTLLLYISPFSDKGVSIDDGRGQNVQPPTSSPTSWRRLNRWRLNRSDASSLCAAALVKLKRDEAVTPPSRPLLRPTTWKQSGQTSKLVCMEGEGCCGDVLCCVQSRRRTGNTFHELLKGPTWRGENAAWPLLVNCTCGWESI